MFSLAADLISMAVGGYLHHEKMREKYRRNRKMRESLEALKQQDAKIQKTCLAIFERCQKGHLQDVPNLLLSLKKKGLEIVSALPLAYCQNDHEEKLVWDLLNQARLHFGLLALPEPV